MKVSLQEFVRLQLICFQRGVLCGGAKFLTQPFNMGTRVMVEAATPWLSRSDVPVVATSSSLSPGAGSAGLLGSNAQQRFR
jgi:hypothetical protein